MLITIIVIVAIICLIVWIASRSKPVSTPIVKIDCCEKCESTSYRFLWDRELIRTETKQEVVQSGFSNSKGTYSGSSAGISFPLFSKGHTRVHFGGHSGTSNRHTESYRIKEVKVNVYRVSCRCNVCGHVWSKIVRDDEFDVSQSAGASTGYSKENTAQLKDSSKLMKQITELLNVNASMPATELAERLEIDITSILDALEQMGRSPNL